jgi:hypothetical protein
VTPIERNAYRFPSSANLAAEPTLNVETKSEKTSKKNKKQKKKKKKKKTPLEGSCVFEAPNESFVRLR